MTLGLPAYIDQIVRELREAGYRALVVGGAVRDALLKGVAKDIDIEVYGISYDRLAEFLGRYGRVDLVGKSFGVVKFTPPSREMAGEPGSEATSDEPGFPDTTFPDTTFPETIFSEAIFDFSVPRRDSKTGRGHRDFLATFDEFITPEEAASRRDFTINAMAYDPLTHELLDFFGGQDDLRNRVLRATSEAFSEDPLRVLRGMQFACRFDLTIDPETAEMSRAIAGEYSTLPTERISEEFMKWAVKGSRPGRLADYLVATGWIVHFPEILKLIGVPQDSQWHPEGDVGVHTMHVVDFAARIAEREKLSADDRAVLLFAALSHDFGKPATTELRERDGHLRWTSWGHEPLGGPIARQFLQRIGIKSWIIDRVVPIIENHLVHHSIVTKTKNARHDFSDGVTPRAVRRLAMRIAPASIEQLIQLVEADASGRPPKEPGLPPDAALILEAAHAEAVAKEPQRPWILGRHVLPYFHDRAGKHIGEVVRAAYEAQADGVFSTEAGAMAWLEKYFSEARAQIE